MPYSLSTPVANIRGVGATRERQLARLGLHTVHDLLYFFPRAYEHRGAVCPLTHAPQGEPCALVLTVATAVRSARLNRGMTLSKLRAFDDTASVEITFFNAPFVKDVFSVGATFRFYGKLTLSHGRLQLANPKYEPILPDRPLAEFIPVYPQTEGLSSSFLARLCDEVMEDALPSLSDPLPESVRLQEQLPTLSLAIRTAHQPTDSHALAAALRRLAYDELLIFGLSIARAAVGRRCGVGIALPPCSLTPLTERLPYELTPSQKRSVNEMYRDMVLGGADGSHPPMSRILIGDVGSGKTVCAAMAIYIAVHGGYQAALMAPTEILAQQHYAELSALFTPLNIRVGLLTGSLSAGEKRRTTAAVAAGEIDLLIGTHALISDGVTFPSLALVVTDEQHRFGVAQRARLREKATSCHLLVMSATPIPRTLALAVYGDLDVSRLTELPPGRQRVDTYVVDETYRERLYRFLHAQVALGGQCYVICPAIEQPEEALYTPDTLSDLLSPSPTAAPPLRDATTVTRELSEALPDLSVALLHGRMKAQEKEQLMQRFASGEIQILVSTTVIEVGVNVPNASLIVVENAERFGLAQLHQLRGRVGRGRRKSYCVLISDSHSAGARARLDVMRSTSDGYEIAERDLAIRGPGDFFSSSSDNNFRQSGGFSFRFARLCDDVSLLDAAFARAKAIIAEDPDLTRQAHALLRERVDAVAGQQTSLLS